MTSFSIRPLKRIRGAARRELFRGRQTRCWSVDADGVRVDILMHGRGGSGRVTTEKLEGSGGEFDEPVHLGDEHGVFFVGAVAGGVVEQFLPSTPRSARG